MSKRKIIGLGVGGLAVVGLLAGGGWWWYARRGAPLQLGGVGGGTGSAYVVSGFIEADEIAVAAELGGRVRAVPVEEGAAVTAGAVVAQLDSAGVEAELAVAQAEQAAAEAALARLKAGAKAEEILRAEQAVELAKAYRAATDQAWQDAKMLTGQQQTLNLQILQAQTQLTVTAQELEAAAAIKDAATAAKDKYDDLTEYLEPYGLSPPYSDVNLQYWRAWIGVNSAEASHQGAEALLAALEAERRWPALLVANMHTAEAAYHAADAAVTQAEAQFADLKAGATAEQIAAGAAQVQIAAAKAAAVETRLQKYTVTAPADGLVLERVVEPGEVVAAGSTLLTLADLTSVALVVYVPENQLNRVQLGQTLTVRVDTFPGRPFTGTVTQVADQAEFIPEKVQTQEDRVSLVFAVKIHLANPDLALKPGMPADAGLP